MTRARVYVDGFNLYYGALRARPAAKWLDLQTLADRWAPGAFLRYFTARISPQPGHEDSPVHQRLYLAALATLPRVEVHFGHFVVRESTLPLVEPIGRRRFVRVLKPEEKGSDVNLATWLLLDGADGSWDEAFVVSDDTDLAEPLREAARRYGPVHLVSPRGLRLGAFTRAAASWRTISEEDLLGCQLPDPVVTRAGRTIGRPPSWR